jgi:hypothetical protein
VIGDKKDEKDIKNNKERIGDFTLFGGHIYGSTVAKLYG